MVRKFWYRNIQINCCNKYRNGCKTSVDRDLLEMVEKLCIMMTNSNLIPKILWNNNYKILEDDARKLSKNQSNTNIGR